MGILSFIPKAKRRWRNLRRASVIAKFIEVLSTHHLFPAVGPSGPLTCTEQFAGRRGLSSDLAALTLSIVTSAVGMIPVYLVFTDAVGAYDKVWREALFAKLAVQHPHLIDVRMAAELYSRMESFIVHKGHTSQVITSTVGIPQGGTRSAENFCCFMADLPEFLRGSHASIEVCRTIFTVMMYMDDYVVPCFTREHVQATLRTLYRYGKKWFVEFDTPKPDKVCKTKVLCLNDPSPPMFWEFGPTHHIKSEMSETFLSVLFSADGKWDEHYKVKVKAVQMRRNALREEGLLGGSNVPAAGVELVQMILWPILDSGRPAADISGRGYSALRQSLARLQIDTLREVLNVSGRAPINGVLGETGCLPDDRREDLRTLQVFRRYISAPKDSLPAKLSREVLQLPEGSEMPPFFARANELLRRYSLQMRSLRHPGAKQAIRKAVFKKAAEVWKAQVRMSPSLSLTYPNVHHFSMQPYLDIDTFPGRTLLTKLRINDLPLNAAGYNTRTPGKCPMCPDHETRQHFIFLCPGLSTVRDDFSSFIPALAVDCPLTLNSRTRMVLLAGPVPVMALPTRAREVGAYLVAIWKERGQYFPSDPNYPSFFP